MGKVGFGGYRISIKSKEHYEALKEALKKGLSLIDTSTNYTNGESEELIGKVLQDFPMYNPIIVTKAGYIQGNNLLDLSFTEDLVEINEHLKHSIHPDFLKDQLTKSLKRLQRTKIDVFLLHNPEYYFQIENPSVDEFYERIKKAFIYLESEVAAGRIQAYGISSNHFILPHTDKEWVSVEKVLEIAKAVSANHHFTHIQFPMNLIEIGALEKFGEYGALSLVEFAKFNNLTTMINRPLNAFSNNQLIRLATYTEELKSLDEANAKKVFDQCMTILKNKWIEEHKKDNEEVVEDLLEVTLMKQFMTMWNTLPTPDAVDQVYHGHFFPFVAQIWGGSLTVEESIPFYQLYDFSKLYSIKSLHEKALKFREQAMNVGLIKEIDVSKFAKEVIETYLNYGIDYVLVGMRKADYVNQLSDMF